MGKPGYRNFYYWQSLYPPHRYLFYPMYKFFRRKLRLPMWVSNLFVWLVSAVLHAMLFIFTGNLTGVLVMMCIFVSLGLLSTVAILIVK